MSPPKPARAKGKRSGKWSVACPPPWGLDDLALVREVDAELGAELLLALYNVRLVAQTPVELRGSLFTPHPPRFSVELAPEKIQNALPVFARVLYESASISERELARACRAVAEWAEDSSRPITAIGFAEAAAHLLPEDAELANLAGRACRRGRDRARAELWYERGWGLARRAGDIKQYVDGHLGFGNLLRDFGEHARAMRWIKRAGLSARKGGLKESGAEALHDACNLAYLREDLGRASSLARRAARVYPVHAQRRPYFSADLALLLSRRGLYQEALELVQGVQQHLKAPVECLHLWGLVAYTAGGAKERETYGLALAEVRGAADTYPEVGGAALAYAAAGAHLLEDWETADELIEEAVRRTEGDALASQLAARVGRDIAARTPGVRRPPDDDPSVAALRGVVPEAAARLRRWRGPTWRPPKK
jgi:tetratricopeptide (TPR) repeat protein